MPWRPVAAGVAVTLALAVAVVVAPSFALAGCAALILACLVAAHPPLAAYVLLGVTPLVAGIDRGRVIPVLRPNEALLVLLGGALLVRGVVRAVSGERLRVRFAAIDLTLLLLAVTSSVLPLLWLVARGKAVTSEDLLYSLTLWKYYGVFLIVRAAVRTEREVARCLWVSVSAAAVVGVVAILQSLHLFGVPHLLSHLWAPFGDEQALDISRGTSTLASSFAVGDVMVFSLAITTTWLARHHPARVVLLSLSGLFVLGCFASGQFSSVIGLAVGLLAVGYLTRRLARGAIIAAPSAVAAVALLQPVLQRRLSGFSSAEGLPSSWVVRLDNLRRFFWPELFSHFHYVLGVRPSGRVRAPETWRTWVWIESGHTWLLWNGGLPLFGSFVAFVWVGLRGAAAVARARADAVGVAAVATFAAVVVVAVLTTFDAHLTLRGTADMLFALLALTFGGVPTAAEDYRQGSSRASVPA